MRAPATTSVQRVSQELPEPTSSAFEESIRRRFEAAPTGRTFVPKYDEEERLPGGTAPFIVPEGMDPFEAQARRRAYYEQAATPADTEAPDPKAREAFKRLYGVEHVAPDAGYQRLREMAAPAERVGTQTQRLDDPELRAKWLDYLAVKYPGGATREQTVKAAAEFLRGDEGELSSQNAPVSQELLREFLNSFPGGERKPKKQRYSDRELRRADEVVL